MGKSMRHIMYLNIYEDIKKTILDGTYYVQSKLPSKRKLANFYNVSVMTIDSAYQQLIAEGYVLSIERKGYFVNEIPEHRFFKPSFDLNQRNVEFNDQQEFDDQQHRMTYFPHQIWAKISRKVLSDDPHMMDLNVDPQGLIHLRYEIKKYLEIYRGVIVSKDQIVIGSGSQAMMQLIIAMIGRDFLYFMEEPGFPKLKEILRHSGIKLITVDQDEQGILIHQIKTNQPALVHVTPSHQYPKGTVMPVGRRIEILNWVNASNQRFILEDDYDSEFRYQGQPIPALQSLDKNSKVIYMNTFSKSLSPAIKINYLVIPTPLMESYQKIKHIMACSVPIFEQKVLTEFLKEHHFERHLNKVKKIYRRKTLYVLERFKHIKHVKITGFEAGLHMVLSFDSNTNIEELNMLIKKKDIHLQKMDDYYDRKPDDCRKFIFEYASLDDHELSKTIDIILAIMQES